MALIWVEKDSNKWKVLPFRVIFFFPTSHFSEFSRRSFYQSICGSFIENHWIFVKNSFNRWSEKDDSSYSLLIFLDSFLLWLSQLLDAIAYFERANYAIYGRYVQWTESLSELFSRRSESFFLIRPLSTCHCFFVTNLTNLSVNFYFQDYSIMNLNLQFSTNVHRRFRWMLKVRYIRYVVSVILHYLLYHIVNRYGFITNITYIWMVEVIMSSKKSTTILFNLDLNSWWVSLCWVYCRDVFGYKWLYSFV